ncbi:MULTISPECIES: hypothetical protein [unclassified Lacinutrix]
MKIKEYKSIILFGAAWILFFFLTEFLMNIFFKDNTPLWKIIAISFISGLGIFYPFLKNSKNFSLNQVKKKQKREITFNAEGLEFSIQEKIIPLLKRNKFKIINSERNTIKFRSKWSLNSYGENYMLTLKKECITIESTPRSYVFPYDSGTTYKQINFIEKEIINLNLSNKNYKT